MLDEIEHIPRVNARGHAVIAQVRRDDRHHGIIVINDHDVLSRYRCASSRNSIVRCRGPDV